MPKTNEKMRELVAQLDEKRKDALQMGGEKRVARQHERGKMDARQRVHYLFDDSTFVEFGTHAFFHVNNQPIDDGKIRSPADGVITGFGEILSLIHI